MAQPTARDLIIDASKTSGVTAVSQNPNGAQAQNALRWLNYDLIDKLRLMSAWPSYDKVYQFVTENNKQEYSIGVTDPILTNPQPDIVVSQDIIRIINGSVQVSSVWSKLNYISSSDQYGLSQAETTAVIPAQFMYNKTDDPFGVIRFTDKTLSGYPIRLVCNGPVLNYALDDIVDLPSGYYSALKYGLAEILANNGGFEENAVSMERKFKEALTLIKEVNTSPTPYLSLDTGMGRYDVNSDTVFSSGLK